MYPQKLHLPDFFAGGEDIWLSSSQWNMSRSCWAYLTGIMSMMPLCPPPLIPLFLFLILSLFLIWLLSWRHLADSPAQWAFNAKWHLLRVEGPGSAPQQQAPVAAEALSIEEFWEWLNCSLTVWIRKGHWAEWLADWDGERVPPRCCQDSQQLSHRGTSPFVSPESLWGCDEGSQPLGVKGVCSGRTCPDHYTLTELLPI